MCAVTDIVRAAIFFLYIELSATAAMTVVTYIQLHFPPFVYVFALCFQQKLHPALYIHKYAVYNLDSQLHLPLFLSLSADV